MATPKRRRLYVNPAVQGTWIRRNFAYWLIGSVAVLAMLSGWNMYQGAANFSDAFNAAWNYASPIILLSAILVPIFLYDTLRTSHRVVGPLFRLNRELGKLAEESKDSQPIKFRDGDFWEEIAMQYNRILNRVRNQDQRMKEYFDQADESRPRRQIA